MIRGREREREREKEKSTARERVNYVCALVEKIPRDVLFLANANTVIRRFVLLTYLQKARERFVDDEREITM